MGREINMKRRRRDLMICNFCEFSSPRYGCQRPEEQDNDAELHKEVERLRRLIKRMTGKEEGVSFTELEALESHLMDARLIVRDLKKKTKAEEDERLLKQSKEAADHGTKSFVLVPCRLSASSSQGRPEKDEGGTPLLKMKRAFDRQNAESLQSEFDRLWLLNERMNGRELHGMTSFDLLYLDLQISRALVALSSQKTWPIKEVLARQQRESVRHDKEEPISRSAEQQRCSSDSDKDACTSRNTGCSSSQESSKDSVNHAGDHC